MSTLRFQDKVAIVTGGCQGIGRGCVDVLVENGGKVIVFDIADKIGSVMSPKGPGEIKYVHCDVTKEEEIKYALPYLRKSKGCIVNISSVAAFDPANNSSTYCATKGGVRSLTKALAIDEAKNGVRVNSIAPGSVDTELLREVTSEETRNHLASCHIMGRISQPREIGQACLFLAVDATFTTGEDLRCTGGLEIGYGVKNGVKDANSFF